ncbi:MAG TPA: sialidase family protein [Planctomycetota bacterium]
MLQFLPVLLCLSPALSALQDPKLPERFSTGPPAGAPTAVTAGPVSGPGSPAGPGGGDIRANTDATSAQNETSFSVNPLDEDNWVGTANDYRFGTVQIGWYSTRDGGATWTTGTFGIDPGYSFSGDPCVAFDPAGVVHVVGMQYFSAGGSAVTSYRSADGGVTWTGGIQIDLNSANDKPQAASDYSNGAHHGDVTTAWNRFFGNGADVLVATTSNGGASWSTAKKINDVSTNTISPDVAYAANSELYVGWADRGNFRAYVDRSSDGGVNWGADVVAASFGQVPSPIPGSSFRMFDIFALAADWTNGPHAGNVYLAQHTWQGGQADIEVATSTDQGATWTVRKVNDDAGSADQVMPGAVVDTKGNLNVSFFDRRLDPANYLLWTWVARSSDGGVTFANHPVSDLGWDHRPTEFGGGFIGDYLDVDTFSGAVHPFWVDGRSGTQDVYTDVVGLDLVADVEQLSAATGGQVHLTVNVGPNFAGSSYIVVGSRSGTAPGTLTGTGVVVPLNRDAFTNWTIANANSARLQNTRGVLDATGSALATIDTLGPLPSGFIGSTVHFAAVTNPGAPTFATNPVGIEIVP